jgi:two-component system NtrC family sensor kinase
MTLWSIVPWLFALAAALTWVRTRQRSRGLLERLGRTEHELAACTAERDQEKLRTTAADDRYAWLVEHIPIGVIISELSGRIVQVNSALAQMLGYEAREELLRKPAAEIYGNPSERKRAVEDLVQKTETAPRELTWRRRDGSLIPVLALCRLMPDDSGAPARIIGIIADRTDRHRLEEDRLRLDQEQRLSARLATVGSLAAGIAHEINTPLQFVSDSVYYLQSAFADVARLLPTYQSLVTAAAGVVALQPKIEEIRTTEETVEIAFLAEAAGKAVTRALDGVERVTRIVRAMREFAHVDHGERTLVDLNHLIETTLTVCKNEYKHIATIETSFGELPKVWVQRGELSQVLLNIIVNAAHAIELQKTRDARAGHIRIQTTMDGAMAVVRVTDNGTGMPESVKARIFDPFFTTKEVGKGTGQGLAIVRSVIVARHKGEVHVETQVGVGTTFELRIPVEVRQPTERAPQGGAQ